MKSILMRQIMLLVIGCWLLGTGSFAQTVSQKIQKAFATFERDSQLKHAISSLYVIDASTGQVVFDKNSQIGLAPASTQKIITSVTAFELLGKDFIYKTELGYTGVINNDTLEGDIFLKGSGDPTLGSWRFESTRDSAILYRWSDAIKKKGIRRIGGAIVYNYKDYSLQAIPDGWIWQDIGNYYGATPFIINWRENQYDILLKSGNEIGSTVEIPNNNLHFQNELKAAAKGTGDNAYVYLPSTDYFPVIAGTIPIGEPAFKISASNPGAVQDLLLGFGLILSKQGIRNKKPETDLFATPYYLANNSDKKSTVLDIYYSPTLDSIIYWFNKKSINLYGEALIKTFAYEKYGFGSTDSGVAIVQKFWKEKGMDEDELGIVDGSGLSPLNRVTTHVQVEILKYAKTKDWFPYFYTSLPEYNGMKIKSGTIRGVKGFCGYHKAKNGKEYIFSFLVNNYNGSASALVNKMYKVLDILK
jgi:serine-type D-Ala-D-Ala carboxypeptidase/endopeptidase (penicillin-binding protein 4)